MQQTIDTGILEQKLSVIINSLSYLMPEAVLTAFLLLLLVVDMIAGRKGAYWLISISLLGFLVHLFMLFRQWEILSMLQQPILLLEMLRLDGIGIFFKGIFSLSGIFAVLLNLHYQNATAESEGESSHKLGEFYVVLYGLLLGASLMVMSINLLMLYMAIEIVSICSYILTNFNFDKKSAEAGIKYLLFGGVASGLMLYGISLVYGFSGTLLLEDPSLISGLSQIPVIILTPTLLLIAAGLLFKVSAVPFHIWAPDVYEGGPTPVIALFSVVPKIAGIAVLLRFAAFFDVFEGQMPMIDWRWVLGVIAIITIVVGNFAALSQSNAKRMMAYSSIAHSGFLLVGVIAYSEFGTESIMFYAAIYLLMNFAAFLLIKMISRETGYEYIEDYKGLGNELPMLGIFLLVVMISLTGLPPTAGFTAKLFIFSALWQTYQASGSTIMLLLLLIGLFNTVVSLFYYLKIPYYMFFKQKEEGVLELKGYKNNYRKINTADNLMVFVLVIPLLILFFKANWLMELIKFIHF
ncbi:NADH-quinone oxidoreductase subunit N [Catalinimonas niigatensis]|uniref:NADH-quinone oxidoreductase subunit N n=1 Tax=Catalinimonas niigatensis TaxID=1397264 RepID=UPI002665CB5F|nr:NADH-quinone oxidoreductase subunit N [Catalinimonas niigatensis]WPP53126.1 NADH-quinone oxidoreductase subunit N [Catalinimonas niigatensis]